MSGSVLSYGTCVALAEVAALLRGPSGSGKSDLALRFVMMSALGESAKLVADDQVLLSQREGRLIARSPEAITGLIEVRGLGIIPVPHCVEAELRLVVDLSAPRDVPRMPPEMLPTADIAGSALPVLRLAPFEASAPLKLRLALERIATVKNARKR